MHQNEIALTDIIHTLNDEQRDLIEAIRSERRNIRRAYALIGVGVAAVVGSVVTLVVATKMAQDD